MASGRPYCRFWRDVGAGPWSGRVPDLPHGQASAGPRCFASDAGPGKLLSFIASLRGRADEPQLVPARSGIRRRWHGPTQHQSPIDRQPRQAYRQGDFTEGLDEGRYTSRPACSGRVGMKPTRHRLRRPSATKSRMSFRAGMALSSRGTSKDPFGLAIPASGSSAAHSWR